MTPCAKEKNNFKKWWFKIAILGKSFKIGAQNYVNTEGFQHVFFDLFYL